MADYYKILELTRENATPDNIKKQYKKLALKYHPDRPNGNGEKFKQVSEAYEILSDENKKRQYDNPNPFTNVNTPFQNSDPNEIFRHFFNNMNTNNMPPNVHFTTTNNTFINIRRPSQNFTQTTIQIINGVKIEKTIEIKDGVKKQIIKETDMNTGKNKIISNYLN